MPPSLSLRLPPLPLPSARSHNGFFWTNPPSVILLVAAFLACSLSTILANVWPESYPDDIYTIGLARLPPAALSLYVWIYCEWSCCFCFDLEQEQMLPSLRRWGAVADLQRSLAR
jgi:hypothetical protein